MASTQPNNAPFLSTKNYLAVAGVSNSPFTDERAVATGGGGGGLGNMVYDNATSQVNYDDGAGPIVVNQITQPGALGITTSAGNLTLTSGGGEIDCDADRVSFAPTAGDPLIRFRNSGVPDADWCQIINDPVPAGTQNLTCTPGGTGTIAAPFVLNWADEPPNVDSLDINYDPVTSLLVLEDPLLPSPVISTTTVVPGRTIKLDNTTVSGTVVGSAIGLSNVTFPPPAAAGLVGNNPPSVNYPNPSTGLTNWFPGASFRAVMAGNTVDFDNNDDMRCIVWSNRGQPGAVQLNSFILNLESTANYGWKWEVVFTCRSINGAPAPLGVIATNSSFAYTDDGPTPAPEGVIISNVNSNFDTDITQYLDFTIQFAQPGNNIQTSMLTIERIF